MNLKHNLNKFIKKKFVNKQTSYTKNIQDQLFNQLHFMIELIVQPYSRQIQSDHRICITIDSY